MSINLFFIFIFAMLVGMFQYFQPHTQQEEQKKEIPQFELDQFVIYEISSSKINRFFEGSHGIRFSDRYVVENAKFSNNERELFESIRSDHALYKDDIVTLNDNVVYKRADGLAFRSNEGKYDQKNGHVSTQGTFVITKESNSIRGEHLHYNLNLDTVSANRIQGIYQLN